MTQFFIVEAPRGTWGDYSAILMHGMSAHLPRREGLIQLERTGPFIPPVSFPALDVIVSDEFRSSLSASGLSGCEFRPVIKARIVLSNWHTWDKAAKEPAEFPPRREPENYILGRRHSPAVAAQLGDLWELLLTEGARIQRDDPEEALDDVMLLADSWRGDDLFRAEGVGLVFATEKARDWLAANGNGYVDFQPAMAR